MSNFRVSHKITGDKLLTNKLVKLEKAIINSTIRATQEATFLIHATAVKSIQDNSTGTKATRYEPKRNVKVSKPGQPPNTDTGRAAQSIKFDFEDGGLVGRVGTNLRYLAWLEFGTKFIAARPWLSAAVNKHKKDIKTIFFSRTNKTIKGGSK